MYIFYNFEVTYTNFICIDCWSGNVKWSPWTLKDPGGLVSIISKIFIHFT